MIITWPDYRVASFVWHKMNQAVVARSVFGSQSIETAPALWQVSMIGVSETRADARLIEALIESLNGYQNQLALWNIEHPIPSGTMRGAMVFAASAAKGATSITLSAGSGQAGTTLLAGDLIGFGSGSTQQVVKIAANATADASGVIAVNIGTPMRNAFVAGDAVTWNKPCALFRQDSLDVGMTYKPDGADAWSLTLREDYRP